MSAACYLCHEEPSVSQLVPGLGVTCLRLYASHESQERRRVWNAARALPYCIEQGHHRLADHHRTTIMLAAIEQGEDWSA